MRIFAILFVFVLALSTVKAEDLVKPIKQSAFCKKNGFKAADGTQKNKPGDKFCVSLEIGQLPDINHMTSCLIVEPRFGQVIRRNKTFTVTAKIQNLRTGFFSDPAVDYYQIPQTLQGGVIQGHSHITIQKIDGRNAPDPKIFAFFKGLNDKAVNGALSVEITNGLPTPGLYRICTMNASNSHQPVVMPVAQRGAQDDCIRIFVK